MIPALLIIQDHLPYARFLELMEGLIRLKIREQTPEILVLTEHEPVLTLGLRAGDSDVLVSAEVLQAKGVAMHRVHRGGLATYHGPGQMMAYPFFHLKAIGRTVPGFVNLVEQVVISTLADFQIEAGRKKGFPGVWAGAEKIASIGLGVKKGITFHGLGLNYGPDLSNFELINPCGLSGVKMTSMARLVGREIDRARLRESLVRHFAGLCGLDFTLWSLDEALEKLEVQKVI